MGVLDWTHPCMDLSWVCAVIKPQRIEVPSARLRRGIIACAISGACLGSLLEMLLVCTIFLHLADRLATLSPVEIWAPLPLLGGGQTQSSGGCYWMLY